jgi:PAS domain S-box-containing protein
MLSATEGHAYNNLLDSLNYTEEHPLIYEDAWDLWPYTFLENSEPTGYNIDMMKMIFEELGIPYVIKLKDTQDALEDLRAGSSDLMLGMDASYHNDYTLYGNTVIHLFTHSVAHIKDSPLTVKTMEDLKNHHVYVHTGSFSHHLMQDRGWSDNAIPFYDMKDALLKVSTEKEGVVLWNTMSQKWLIRQYHLDNLELTPIDLPHGEYKFMSNNRILLALLDSTYTALCDEERLNQIQNKWFYPEQQETGIPSWVWMVANILVVIFIGTVGVSIFYKIRERRVTHDIRKNNARLALTLSASGVRIWTYNIWRQTFTWLDQNGNSKHEYTLLQFFRNYNSEELDKMMQALNRLSNKETDHIELFLRVPSDVNSKEMNDYAILLSVFHYDKDGKPKVIIGTNNDISQDRHRQKRVKDTLLRYQAILDSVMIDMVYFNKQGLLSDLNEKACQTFNYDRTNLLDEGITIRQFYDLSDDVTLSPQDSFYATIKMNHPTLGKIWYELKLQPLYDSDNQLLGYYGTGRDVTETSRSYHQRQHALNLLSQANEEEQRYIRNIDYALKVGGMRFVTYQPDNHILTIYNGISDIHAQLTQTRAIHFLNDSSRKTALRILNNMDSRSTSPINVTLKTTLRQSQDHMLFLQFILVPIYDEQNRVKDYFGILRDVSEIKTTEEQLAQETEKAQAVETIKNAFLHNMNYEIRSPLNSIVGFAEFFQLPHSAEDEVVFVREIKENSAALLKLINNILFLSRIDARMIEIKPRKTDFALMFDSMCNTYWSSYQNNNGGKNVSLIIENHYQRMLLEVDDQNIGHILEQIMANAIQFTEKGRIRARYDYTGDQLIVSIEDTGCGINPQLTDHIFDRFATGANNGNGLGLSICHELVRLMGGTINIKSDLGKGTTVWFAIPCKALEIERKDIAS